MDLANFGVLQLSQGNYSEAGQNSERALGMGIVNPQVSSVVNRLALDVQRDGDPERAEAIYEWALEVSEQKLGADDGNTAYLRTQYEQFLRSIGRAESADAIAGT